MVNTTSVLKGRDLWRERYKEANGTDTDVDDDTLLDYANERYSDLDGKHNGLAEANGKLAEMTRRDPKFGATLSMMVGEGKSLPYAIGSIYGRDWIDDDLEEFEAGYQESLNKLAESEKAREEADANLQKSMERIEAYIKEEALSEDEGNKLVDNILSFADNLLMGNIPDNVIKLIHKGEAYEQDVRDALETGIVEGRNERIDAQKRRMTGGASGSGVYDMGGKSTGGEKPSASIAKRHSSLNASSKACNYASDILYCSMILTKRGNEKPNVSVSYSMIMGLSV